MTVRTVEPAGDEEPHPGSSLRWSHAARRDPVRRPAAGVVRRAGGARGRHPVPGERHPRPRRPPERLEEVGEHYFLFGGRSPINDQNRAFLAAIREDLHGAGLDLPVYWGNRNWDPYLVDAVTQMRDDGVTRAASFLTSAYSSYSSCRQYREDLAAAAAAVEGAPRLDRLRAYFNHPRFIEPVVDATLAALAELPDDVRNGAHLVFVTHSIPTEMNERSGPWGRAYLGQHRSARHRGRRAGAPGGRPQAPVAAGLLLPLGPARRRRGSSPTSTTISRTLAKDGASAAVVRADRLRLRPHGGPLRPRHRGAATAERLSLPMTRAATPGLDPRFVACLVSCSSSAQRPSAARRCPGSPSAA